MEFKVSSRQRARIVLVHGVCHGAWCWYKLKPLLEASGHDVTALDLSASGVDQRSLDDIRTLEDYTKPLLEFMASIPQDEKVVLVGHSMGGLNIAVAMDKYPEKIGVAVFLSASLPDATHAPSYVLDRYCEQIPADEWLDTKFSPIGTPENPQTSMLFGPKFISLKLYQLCSPQDVALANMLLRPGSLFLGDLSKKTPFSNEGFGSVKRVYVVCPEDKAVSVNFQYWQIENFGVDEVKEIASADHMVMLSKPQELCQCLLEISKSYV
ncbi:salicylic acid-binding protein 2 isoform X1 [Primulina eburnea]|uniref:salicylic acid-binding protein 2 isoform X1 n=2 Tax=Primulina eburnea TaxID=1245227 RepID=UPI003C6C4C65